jgi:hypothetical protein
MSPRWGPRKCQLLATPCVALSLALFSLGGSNPSGRFCLGTMRFIGPLAIVGLVWDTVTVTRVVIAGMMCKE